MRFDNNEFSGLTWHQRNLRIMSNLHQTGLTPDDRVLVVYGQGHIPLFERIAEDSPYFDSADVSRDDLQATYIGPLMLDALEAMCSVWPKGALDDDFKTPVATDLPVLLLSGEADPITPPAYGDLAAVDMQNALHLTGRKQGHGQAIVGCMPRIIGDFVDTGSIEDLDTGCIDRFFAMPFFLDFSGPSP